MIWKRLFPPEGGGTLRRWVRMRKEMFESAMKDTQESNMRRNNLKSYMKPLTIFDFNKYEDDVADAMSVHAGMNKGGWRISDDEVIGGFSRATFTLQKEMIPMTDRNKNRNIIRGGETKNKNDDNDTTNTNTNTTTHNFIRWKGNIDTRIGPKSRARKSGFCAIRCPEFPFGGIPVGHKYNALEIKCRSDGRTYTLNLKVDSYFPDDLYQSHITVSPQEILDAKKAQLLKQKGTSGNSDNGSGNDNGNNVAIDPSKDFVSVVLPFRDFLLTSHGLVKHHQRSLDGAIQLKHLGLTLMDQKDGPFQLDIARIRLVNYDDGEVLNDLDDDISVNSTNDESDAHGKSREEDRQVDENEDHAAKKAS